MVKLATGSFGDSFSATSIRSYIAEFIATLLFVFAGVGSAISYGELLLLAVPNICPGNLFRLIGSIDN
jgi:aquaporin TIP